MDLRIWADSTNYNIIVLSDTWLNKSVLDSIIHIDGYNVFRSARTKEGGGIAVYIKSKLNCTCILSISKPKCFELLAIKLLFLNGPDIIVVRCYRPPSASSEAITSLMDLLHNWTKSEMIVLGDLNWD